MEGILFCGGSMAVLVGLAALVEAARSGRRGRRHQAARGIGSGQALSREERRSAWSSRRSSRRFVGP